MQDLSSASRERDVEDATVVEFDAHVHQDLNRALYVGKLLAPSHEHLSTILLTIFSRRCLFSLQALTFLSPDAGIPSRGYAYEDQSAPESSLD